MMQLRKTQILREILYSDETGRAHQPVTRIVGLAVVQNPFAGTFGEDLTELFEMGAKLGEDMMPELMSQLPGDPVGYGKAALVGTAGVMEHGAAMIHPRLGKPMRAAVGGGEALIPANAKVAAMGTSLDLPLGHKDNPWSFDYIDTITIQIADAPRVDEILLCMAVTDGPRAHARVGTGPAVV